MSKLELQIHFYLLKKFAIILLADVIILGYWVYKIHPDPSISIALLFFIPFIFVINLLLALLVFLFFEFILKQKDNQYSSILAVNSVISPVLLFLFFGYATDRNVADRLRSYPFTVNNKKYELTFDLINGNFFDNSRFNIYELEDGGERGIMLGKYYQVKDTVFLDNDTSVHGFLPTLAQQPFKMKMVGKRLTGFPMYTGEIKLGR